MQLSQLPILFYPLWKTRYRAIAKGYENVSAFLYGLRLYEYLCIISSTWVFASSGCCSWHCFGHDRWSLVLVYPGGHCYNSQRITKGKKRTLGAAVLLMKTLKKQNYKYHTRDQYRFRFGEFLHCCCFPLYLTFSRYDKDLFPGRLLAERRTSLEMQRSLTNGRRRKKRV